jgi:uncharacterized protein (UPF0548 family)
VFASSKPNGPRQKHDPGLPRQGELVEAFDRRPAGHAHNYGVIRLFLAFVLAATGFRAAGRVLKIAAPLLPSGRSPSANGGQFWLLRLGLYELTRRKELADDWVWLIDHTIQTGKGKCFLVAGVRLSAWNALREAALRDAPDASFALRHQDLSMFLIELMESSTAEGVRQQLEVLSAETGITPCAVLSDQGADVRRGAELFCQRSARDTVVVFDIAHAVANAIKRQLNGDPAWERFLSDANHFKTQVRQTACAFLIPPELKNKARWMNLEPLIAWSRRVAAFLADPQSGLDKAQAGMDVETLKRKLGWITRHAEPITRWSEMMAAAGIILKYIRNQGYHPQACRELRPRLKAFRSGPARAVVDECLNFIRQQSEQSGGQRVLGSSEVLESLIGKGKHIQGLNKNGYTKSILGLAAAVTDQNIHTIRAAFSAVKVADVVNWIRKHLGLSIQAQRQRALPCALVGTKMG